MRYGFVRVASAVPELKVAAVSHNVEQMERLIGQAEEQGVELVAFPELSLTGYTCGDLFRQQQLLRAAEDGVSQLLRCTKSKQVAVVVGVPVSVAGGLLNVAAIMQDGLLLGMVVKTYLPNYNEFYERRWFMSSMELRTQTISYAGQQVTLGQEPWLLSLSNGAKVGVELCEDVWSVVPPSSTLALLGADIIVNLSASNELIGKHGYLRSLLAQQSARCIAGYVYSSAGWGESTQDVVYGGNALIYENGTLLAGGERFATESQLVTTEIDVERLRADRQNNTSFRQAQVSVRELKLSVASVHSVCPTESTGKMELRRYVAPHPFIPETADMRQSCEEIFAIQVMGLAKRMAHTQARHVIVGVSGGLDSTLALLVCARTFDKLGMKRDGIVGVTMPGFGTTGRTYNNAIRLMRHLGVTIREISITESVRQHFSDIGHDEAAHDVTYENSQARERTQILMDLSNQLGGLVIGTGDLSELALGWATYNGDHMSMYGVNVSIPKTLIRHLVRYVADYEIDGSVRDTLLDIIDTPISPELIPADANGQIRQKTEELVGPYELHDFFLFYFLRYGFSPAKIMLLARQAFQRQTYPRDLAEPVGRYDDETISHWLQTFLRRFFAQQFKRSCLPDGPKVGSVSLSPRGDWRMPTDAVVDEWIKDLENNGNKH